MKNVLPRAIIISLLATSLTTTSSTQAMEKIFNELDMKSVAVGAGFTAVIGATLYLISGREKPSPTQQATLTRTELNEVLGPLQQKVEKLESQQDAVLKILQATKLEDSSLAQLLLKEFSQQSGDEFRGRRGTLNFDDREEQDREESPSRLTKPESAREFPTSPMKKLREIPSETKLTQYQQQVRDIGYNHISERAWAILNQNDDCAQKLCQVIIEETDTNAEFDVLITNDNSFKLRITKNKEAKDKIHKF